MTSILVPASRLERVKATGPALLLSAWTLFVWATRVRNIVADTTLTGFARTWSMAVAVGFTAAGLAVGGLALAWVAGVGGALTSRLGNLAGGLAVVGGLWWAVRGVDIALGDHGLGFKVVHAVLALVTMGLGVIVVRWVRRSAPTGPLSAPSA